jgi:hypothetical protein
MTDVLVTGISAQGLVGAVLVWTVVDDDQVPGWQDVSDAQSESWGTVNDTNTVTWTQVPT